MAESVRFLMRLKQGTSEEAKVSRRRSFWGKPGVQQQYDGITTRGKLESSVVWKFVFIVLLQADVVRRVCDPIGSDRTLLEPPSWPPFDSTLSRITSAITGHERKSNHFAPARMSAPCACTPSMGVLLWGAL